MPITRTLTPMSPWSCQFCNQHRAPPPFAELVSNPTPLGQITRECASLIIARHGRDICRLVKGTWLEIEEYAFAHFLTPLKASSLLNFVMPTLLKNHPKSAEKSHTVSNSSIRFFPIRVHVFVMRLADLKAKPNANHANAHPMRAWSCRICNQRCTPPPFAELVSNPTPPGTSPASPCHWFSIQRAATYACRNFAKQLV